MQIEQSGERTEKPVTSQLSLQGENSTIALRRCQCGLRGRGQHNSKDKVYFSSDSNKFKKIEERKKKRERRLLPPHLLLHLGSCCDLLEDEM